MSDSPIEKKEQRGFSRSPVKVSVMLSSGDASPIEGDARDLSMNGVFVRCKTQPPVDSSCRIELNLDDLVQVKATGKVARLTEEGVAVTFIEVLGVESFEHLQRLVLYNNTDPEQVLEESKYHVGIRQSEI